MVAESGWFVRWVCSGGYTIDLCGLFQARDSRFQVTSGLIWTLL